MITYILLNRCLRRWDYMGFLPALSYLARGLYFYHLRGDRSPGKNSGSREEIQSWEGMTRRYATRRVFPLFFGKENMPFWPFFKLREAFLGLRDIPYLKLGNLFWSLGSLSQRLGSLP